MRMLLAEMTDPVLDQPTFGGKEIIIECPDPLGDPVIRFPG